MARLICLQQDECEIQKNSISPGQKVVIIDDLLATGGKVSIYLYTLVNTVNYCKLGNVRENLIFANIRECVAVQK